MGSIEKLEAIIKELENKLEMATRKNVRQKIDQISSEVVDSNPYRYGISLHCSMLFFIAISVV